MDDWRRDIEKYLSGKMTPEERHALEKKALTDPLFADALEGAETVSPETFSLDLDELNQKIRNKNKDRWMWPLRIAASVVGIAIISMVVFFSMQDDSTDLVSTEGEKKSEAKSEAESNAIATDSLKQSEARAEEEILAAKAQEKKKSETLIAQNKSKEETEQSSLSARSSDLQLQSLSGGSRGKSTLPKIKEGIVGPTARLVSDSISQSGLAAALSTSKSEEAVELVNVIVADDGLLAKPINELLPSETAGELNRARKSQPLNLIVVGEVRDQQGQPLPGVNITVKGTTTGAVSNADGKYSIALSEPNQTLVYSFVGFVPVEQTVDKSKKAGLDVQLQEDATQLSEVVVTTGTGASRKNEEPIVRLAEPQGGRKAYDQYLETKKIYPQQALENKVEGKVVIEFTITISGAITDFNVVREIGFGCEEEVMRLVKEGPKWYPTYIDNEAVESLVRVKTRFELKK